MEQMLFLVPLAGLLGLLFAVILKQQIAKEDAGTDRMKEIAGAIAEKHSWHRNIASLSFL